MKILLAQLMPERKINNNNYILHMSYDEKLMTITYLFGDVEILCM
jgi:hypothetical protein